MTKTLALRIDVDTLRGTGRGVPVLCEILDRHRVHGTFYFSLGPDNMGRHLWRLLKPAFLWKMLRTNAAGLYGPEIILMGTAWPGPGIARWHGAAIAAAVAAGHEAGFHAWDHHRAQSRLTELSPAEMHREIETGCSALTELTGTFPSSSAAPGWRANELLLLEKTKFPFAYNSDCRGTSPFYPIVNGEKLGQLQIPVTLPTYDEVLGRDGVTDDNYNDYQLSLLRNDALNVLTIHAEAEGGRCARQFDTYMTEVIRRGFRVITMGEAENENLHAPEGHIRLTPFPGREGLLAVQASIRQPAQEN